MVGHRFAIFESYRSEIDIRNQGQIVVGNLRCGLCVKFFIRKSTINSLSHFPFSYVDGEWRRSFFIEAILGVVEVKVDWSWVRVWGKRHT